MLKITSWFGTDKLEDLKVEYQEALGLYLQFKGEQSKINKCTPRCAVLSVSKRKAWIDYAEKRVAYLEHYVEKKFHTT